MSNIAALNSEVRHPVVLDFKKDPSYQGMDMDNAIIWWDTGEQRYKVVIHKDGVTSRAILLEPGSWVFLE